MSLFHHREIGKNPEMKIIYFVIVYHASMNYLHTHTHKIYNRQEMSLITNDNKFGLFTIQLYVAVITGRNYSKCHKSYIAFLIISTNLYSAMLI